MPESCKVEIVFRYETKIKDTTKMTEYKRRTHCRPIARTFSSPFRDNFNVKEMEGPK
jgi:hypothetical protein